MLQESPQEVSGQGLKVAVEFSDGNQSRWKFRSPEGLPIDGDKIVRTIAGIRRNYPDAFVTIKESKDSVEE